ncbi:hypothetical protein CAPTEDRAFT_215318 [Capitella teleta]|uniref:Uncharacterized protein n=1 Tax=Capitella teleta TaxID=283909 RepID=R7UVB3_CAPTE|nr:hypothetical protein CAPTEDRAFT_215318 [Capitella teleta]|eukprot:ELU10219.1 hypothetical protein CAPTEDRAFT_215318 [Capitella teleta]
MRIFVALTLIQLADFTCGVADMCPWKPLSTRTIDGVTRLDFANLFTDTGYFYFGIRACVDAKSPILEMQFDGKDSVDYIILGAKNYTEVKIKQDNEVLYRANMALLDCNEMKYFWVSWAHGELQFGRGLSVDNDVIAAVDNAQAQSSSLVRLNLKILSGIAEVETDCDIGKMQIYIQSNLFPVFAPPADSALGVADMCPWKPMSTPTNDGATRLDFANLFTDTGYFYFGIKAWVHGGLYLGRGLSVGNDIITAVADAQAQSSSLVRLNLKILSGFAEVETDCGVADMCPWRLMSTRTINGAIRLDYANLFTDTDYFYFGIRACVDAKSPILEMQFDGKDSVHYIFLGANNHTQVKIKQDNEVLYRANMALLDCNEMKYFWVSWAHGELHFGRGLSFGNDIITAVSDAQTQSSSSVRLDLKISSGFATVEAPCGQ